VSAAPCGTLSCVAMLNRLVRPSLAALRWPRCFPRYPLNHAVLAPPPVTSRHRASRWRAQYTNSCIKPFAVGDRILLSSDGVLEARNRAGEFFDGECVGRRLSTIEPTTADWFSDVAVAELTRWSDRGQFDDDVTFVVAAMTA
jgi:hypothetical protein